MATLNQLLKDWNNLKKLELFIFQSSVYQLHAQKIAGIIPH